MTKEQAKRRIKANDAPTRVDLDRIRIRNSDGRRKEENCKARRGKIDW